MTLRTRSEERLWKEYQRTREVHVRNLLVEMHLSIVPRVVTRSFRNLPKYVDRDELRAVGNLGLIKAVEKFEPARGVPFPPYGMIRVRGEILGNIRDTAWAPRDIQDKWREMRRLREKFRRVHDREPTVFELAELLNVSYGEALSMGREARLRHMYPASVFDLKLEHRDETDFLDSIPDSRESWSQLVDNRDEIKTRLRVLTKRERIAFTLYYGSGLHMKKVGRLLHISESMTFRYLAAAREKLQNTPPSA